MAYNKQMMLHICMIFFVADCCWLVTLAKLDQLMNSSPLVQNVQNKGHVFKLTLKEPAKTNKNILGYLSLGKKRKRCMDTSHQ